MNTIFITFDAQYQLARSIAQACAVPLTVLDITVFADGECEVALPQNIDFQDAPVVIIQPLAPPVHDNFFKICSTLHAVRAAGARHSMLVIPYFGYARHDINHGKPGMFETVVKMLEISGMDACVTVELHNAATVDFFTVPVINVTLNQVWREELVKMGDIAKMCLVSPDAGGAQRVQDIAHDVHLEVIIFEKQRVGADKIQVSAQSTSRKAHAVIIDDMIDTGRTACTVAAQLHASGVQQVDAFFVHPVLAQPAQQLLSKAHFENIVVTNSIQLPASFASQIRVVDIGSYVALAVKKLLNDKKG